VSTPSVRRALAPGILSVVLFAALAVPAVAHDGWISKSGRGKAGTHTTHAYTDSCDEYSDGLSVRAWGIAYRESAGPLSWDPDGAGGQCAHNLIYNGTIWVGHKVCVEQPIGCAPDPGYVTHI